MSERDTTERDQQVQDAFDAGEYRREREARWNDDGLFPAPEKQPPRNDMATMLEAWKRDAAKPYRAEDCKACGEPLVTERQLKRGYCSEPCGRELYG